MIADSVVVEAGECAVGSANVASCKAVVCDSDGRAVYSLVGSDVSDVSVSCIYYLWRTVVAHIGSSGEEVEVVSVVNNAVFALNSAAWLGSVEAGESDGELDCHLFPGVCCFGLFLDAVVAWEVWVGA